MNFRVAPVQKALVSASKVCHKGYRIIMDSEPEQSDMLHKRTGEWIGLREEWCPRFQRLDFSRNDSWQKEIEGPQSDTV